MEQFLDKVAAVNDVINTFVWVKIGIIILLGVGIVTTVCTKFFQLSHLGLWWKNTIGSLFRKHVIGHTKDKGAISPFQALCTALAATVGTGNIAGVSAAICIGGAGAVFWMWLAAFFGMMTNYSENVLGIYFRRRNKAGEWSGGAMYYLEDGLGGKRGCKHLGRILTVLFSIFAIFASFGIGSMGQINKIVINITSAFPVQSLLDAKVFGDISVYALIIGIALMLLGGLIVLGGLKRIASVAERVVPFMVVLFVVGSLVIIGVNYANILPAFKAIFVGAFKPIAAIGGGIGVLISTVITQGFKRGVFSNEAGLGSAPIAAAAAQTHEPVRQGLVSMTGTFIDTVIVCTMTGLSIMVTGAYDFSTANGLDGVDVTIWAFSNGIPWAAGVGSAILMVCLALFAFTTILGWDYYSERCLEYLTGGKMGVVKVYRWFYILAVLIGPFLTLSAVWTLADIFNGLMAIPNLIALVALSGVIVAETKSYFKRLEAGHING